MGVETADGTKLSQRTPEGVRCEPGMLLLDPEGVAGKRPTVWCVESPRVLVAHFGDCQARVTITKSFVPTSWTILDNAVLGKHLVEMLSQCPELADKRAVKGPRL